MCAFVRGARKTPLAADIGTPPGPLETQTPLAPKPTLGDISHLRNATINHGAWRTENSFTHYPGVLKMRKFTKAALAFVPVAALAVAQAAPVLADGILRR